MVEKRLISPRFEHAYFPQTISLALLSVLTHIINVSTSSGVFSASFKVQVYCTHCTPHSNQYHNPAVVHCHLCFCWCIYQKAPSSEFKNQTNDDCFKSTIILLVMLELMNVKQHIFLISSLSKNIEKDVFNFLYSFFRTEKKTFHFALAMLLFPESL